MSLITRLRRGRSVEGRARGPRSLSVVLDAVVQHAQQLQLLLVTVGVLGLCLVPLLERKIDFDENALLAGSARPTLRWEGGPWGAVVWGEVTLLCWQDSSSTAIYKSFRQQQSTARGLLMQCTMDWLEQGWHSIAADNLQSRSNQPPLP